MPSLTLNEIWLARLQNGYVYGERVGPHCAALPAWYTVVSPHLRYSTHG